MICPTSGKQALSRSDAQTLMRDLRQDRWTDRPELLNIYRCRDCRRYHVGHAFAGTPRTPRDTGTTGH